MSTATKPARKTKAKATTTPNGDPIPDFVQRQIDKNESAAKPVAKVRRIDTAHTECGPTAVAEMIGVGLITVAENDRQTFDAALLQQLADSIKSSGLLNPLTVTPDGDGFRLIAGERRLRACRLAKLTHVPCMVQRGGGTFGDISTEMIAWQRYEENALRQDLNPIETAQAFRGLLQHCTQAQLAKRIGITQGQVSNTVRMLELPEMWQRWVAAGKLAATAVRILLPYSIKRPQVLQWLVDQYATTIDEGSFELTDDILRGAIVASTRPLQQRKYYDHLAPSAKDCWFKFDAEQDQSLDAEELNCSWAGPQLRAWNVQAWDERNKQPFRKAREKFTAAKAAREKSNGGSKPATVQPSSSDAFDERYLGHEITRDLLRMLGSALQEKKHASAVPLVYIYLTMTEVNADLPQRLSELSRKTSMYLQPAESLMAIRDVRGKAVQSLMADLVVQTLLHEADDTTGWLPDGLDQPSTIVGIAKALVDLDLLAIWVPSLETLACCAEWFLRQVGYKVLNIKPDEQPEDIEGLHHWLAQDWPAGHVPAEMSQRILSSHG